MISLLHAAVPLLALGGTWALTAAVLRYAQSTNLVDVPNERSSHARPTPRGGGVAIVAVFLVVVAACGLLSQVSAALTLALLGAGVLVAVLGFLDDRHGLPARVRFTGHAAAAAWVLAWLPAIPPVPVLGMRLDLGILGIALSALFLLWMINLFNFMDGIDGIASVEAITCALSGAVVWAIAGQGGDWVLALLFAGCVAGFLIWNFPPAKIFMGDAGSGFLGLVVATLALWCGQGNPALFWSWFILVGCFMVDATTTLVRRVRRGERFFEAHRAHAYQYASRRHGRHLPVTLACGAINLLWLLPLALLVAVGRLDGVLGVALAYAPLLWLAFHYRAGDRAGQERP